MKHLFLFKERHGDLMSFVDGSGDGGKEDLLKIKKKEKKNGSNKEWKEVLTVPSKIR